MEGTENQGVRKHLDILDTVIFTYVFSMEA